MWKIVWPEKQILWFEYLESAIGYEFIATINFPSEIPYWSYSISFKKVDIFKGLFVFDFVNIILWVDALLI